MKSAKKFPVTIRLRDLARLNPCGGGLEKAKAVLGAEPELNINLAKACVEANIPAPWIGKSLSAGTNHRIGIQLARKSVQGLVVLTDSRLHQNVLKETAKILNYVNITRETLSALRLKLHVAFRQTNVTVIIGTGYSALVNALNYIESANRRDDQMVKFAMDCVDALTQVEAHLITYKVKVPLYNLFVEGVADEKRERVMKTMQRLDEASAKLVVTSRKKMDKIACNTTAKKKKK